MKCASLIDLKITYTLHVITFSNPAYFMSVCNHVKIYGTVISEQTVMLTTKKTKDVCIAASVTIKIKFFVFRKGPAAIVEVISILIL